MNLQDALLKFSKEKISTLKEIYRWPMNLSQLHVKLEIEAKDVYAQHIELRFKLHEHYLKAQHSQEHYALVKWYIYHWGGVRGNHQSTLVLYTSSLPEQLIQRGARGIASWSKALSVIDPKQYAIYDARVAIALNALQIIYAVQQPIYYPLLSSQNKTIQACTLSMHPIVKTWDKMPKNAFYINYLDLLKTIAHEIGQGVTHHEVEMLLFSYAEELGRLAQKHM